MSKNKGITGIVKSHVIDAFSRTKNEIKNNSVEKYNAVFEFNVDKMFNEIVESIKTTSTDVADLAIDIKQVLADSLSQLVKAIKNEKLESDFLNDFDDEDENSMLENYMDNTDYSLDTESIVTPLLVNTNSTKDNDIKFNFFKYLLSTLNPNFNNSFKAFVLSNLKSNDMVIYNNLYGDVNVEEEIIDCCEFSKLDLNFSNIFNDENGKVDYTRVKEIMESIKNLINFINNDIVTNKNVAADFFELMSRYINIYNSTSTENVEMSDVIQNIDILNMEEFVALEPSTFKRIFILFVVITENISEFELSNYKDSVNSLLAFLKPELLNLGRQNETINEY